MKWLLEQEKMWVGIWFHPSGIDWMVVVCYCWDVLWVAGCAGKRVTREEKRFFGKMKGKLLLLKGYSTFFGN